MVFKEWLNKRAEAVRPKTHKKQERLLLYHDYGLGDLYLMSGNRVESSLKRKEEAFNQSFGK